MDDPHLTLTRQWIDRAESDLLNVANNVAAEQVPWDTVCFHCQQAVEKYLKAVLVILEEQVPRIHDLEQLLDLVKVNLPELAECREDLRWLTTWAVASRYPVEAMDARPGEADGRRAQAVSGRVRSICRTYLKAVVPPA